jgi:hypothetical protein
MTALEEQVAFADECLAITMKVAERLPLATSDEGIAAGVFFARSASLFKGAVLLAKHELPIESMLLTRALIETNFVLVALVSGHLSRAMVLDDEMASRTKLARQRSL